MTRFSNEGKQNRIIEKLYNTWQDSEEKRQLESYRMEWAKSYSGHFCRSPFLLKRTNI